MSTFAVTAVGTLPQALPPAVPALFQFQGDGVDLGAADVDTINVAGNAHVTRGTGESANVVTITGPADASEVPFTPGGNIGADDVEAAIHEVDTENRALSAAALQAAADASQEAADALAAAEAATVISGTWTTDLFVGDGTTTAFTLTRAPGSANNTDISISGVTQRPGVDYTVTGTTLAFSEAPPAPEEPGEQNICVRMGAPLPEPEALAALAGTGVGQGSALVRFIRRVTGAVARWVEDKLSDHVCVHDFGVVGEGGDDTAVFNLAITTLNAQGGKWVLDGRPGKTYLINSTSHLTGVQMKTGVSVNLRKAKVSPAQPNSQTYRLFYFEGISDSGVYNGTIEGDVDSNTNTTTAPTSAQGHGVYVIAGGARLKFHGLEVKKCFGDGVYIGRDCADVSVSGCTITDNWRNNLSIVAGSNVRVLDNEIARASGTAPQAGVDIEPNPTDTASGQITLLGNNIHHNAGQGVDMPAPNPPTLETAIVNANHIHHNGGDGVKVSYCKHAIVNANHIHDNGGAGVNNSTTVVESMQVDNNNIRNNGNGGIRGFAPNAKLRGNTIKGHTYGVHWQLGEGLDASGNTITDCSEDAIFGFRLYKPNLAGNIIRVIQKHGIHLTGEATSSATRTRRGTITGGVIDSVGLAADDTYDGIHLDQYTNTMTVTGVAVERATTGNAPRRAIFAADATNKVVGCITDTGAKAGNSQVEVGGVAAASFLNSPDFMPFIFTQRIYGPGGVFISWGTGSPEGVLTAPVGSKYYRLDGGAGTSEYTKESGTGNTGWAAK